MVIGLLKWFWFQFLKWNLRVDSLPDTVRGQGDFDPQEKMSLKTMNREIFKTKLFLKI